jgi:hypothetical protein
MVDRQKGDGMRIREVVVSRTVRVNTGNYEGTEHFVSMKAEVDPELDDVTADAQALAAVVEKAVCRQLVRSYKVRGKGDMSDPAKVARHHGLSWVPGKDEV